MRDTKAFIRAYHDFKRSVDFTQSGILPKLDDLIWCMLMGVPDVPADDDASEDAPMEAIDQRVSILKAVFVEVNADQPDEFLDQGLNRYDQASKMAKVLLQEADALPDPEEAQVDSKETNRMLSGS